MQTPFLSPDSWMRLLRVRCVGFEVSDIAHARTARMGPMATTGEGSRPTLMRAPAALRSMGWAVVLVLVNVELHRFPVCPLVGWVLFSFALTSLRGLHGSVTWLRRIAILMIPVTLMRLVWKVDDFATLFATGSVLTRGLLILDSLVPACFVWVVVQIPIDLARQLEQPKLERKLVRRRIGVLATNLVLLGIGGLHHAVPGVDLEGLFPAALVAYVLWAIALGEYSHKLGTAIDVYRTE